MTNSRTSTLCSYFVVVLLVVMSIKTYASVALQRGHKLAYTILSAPHSWKPQPPVVILHGLLGSSKNFLSWAKLLQEKMHIPAPIVLMDLRNHGYSPHIEDFTYSSMADDVLHTLADLNIHSCHLIGHSVGGKVAAMCAQQHQYLPADTKLVDIQSLSILDISPVNYSSEEFSFLQTCLQQLHHITNHWHQYADKKTLYDELILPTFADASFAKFILSNVIVRKDTKSGDQSPWQWLFHLSAIQNNYQHILDFPLSPSSTSRSSSLPTLILKGSRSKFVRSSHLPAIRTMFPEFAVVTVKDAGHWVHIDQPHDTTSYIAQFLRQLLPEQQSQEAQLDSVSQSKVDKN